MVIGVVLAANADGGPEHVGDNGDEDKVVDVELGGIPPRGLDIVALQGGGGGRGVTLAKESDIGGGLRFSTRVRGHGGGALARSGFAGGVHIFPGGQERKDGR